MSRFLEYHHHHSDLKIDCRWSKQGWMKSMARVKRKMRRKEQEMIFELETGAVLSGAKMGSFMRF